uniref:CAP_N domain-containing protein n=1 Tax=Caenorhabditis tropicalis TaxID=1561998 RepID=A0A1I7TK00_9PELO
MNSSLVARLEYVADKMENLLIKYENIEPSKYKTSLVVSSKTNSIPMLVHLLDDSVEEKLQKFWELSKKIGGGIENVVEMLKSAFDAHRKFIWTACGREQPNSTEFANLVRDLSMKMAAITEFKEKSNRSSPIFDHISALEAAVCGLGWVAQSKNPATTVKDATETSLFYINRILVSHKGKTIITLIG